jgi:hypothetical protein
MASMQYDVLASKPRTTDGQMQDQNNNDLPRCRIKSVYGVSGAAAGSVVFRDGGASGSILMTMNSPAAAASGTFWLPMPGEGILVRTNLYVDLTDVESIMVIYG